MRSERFCNLLITQQAFLGDKIQITSASGDKLLQVDQPQLMI